MNTATAEKYRDRLRDLRSDLVSEFQSEANGVAEDVQPKGDVSSLPTHLADQDSEGIMEHVALGQLERERIEEIDEALRRIAEGTFGYCEACGKEISQQRLDAMPYTPYCIDCAREREAGRGGGGGGE